MVVKGDKNTDKKWHSILVLVFITIAAGAVTYFLMPIFMPADQNDVLIIAAEDGPIKVKPDDVGGKAIKNQDSAVMSMIANNAKTDVGVENLRPSSSEPELPPVSLEKDAPKTFSVKETDNKTNVNIASVDPKPTDDEFSASIVTSDNETISNDITKTDKSPTLLIPTAKPEIKEQKSASTKPKKIIKTDNPLYRVQLAAFRNADKGKEVASLLAEKHRTRLNNTILETTKIETKDNGVFWRIVTEPLVRADADNLCDLLKRAGQDCILRKVKTAGQ